MTIGGINELPVAELHVVTIETQFDVRVDILGRLSTIANPNEPDFTINICGTVIYADKQRDINFIAQ